MYQLLLIALTGLLPLYLIKIHLLHLPTNLFELLVIILSLLGIRNHQVRSYWKNGCTSLPSVLKLCSFGLLIAALISTLIVKGSGQLRSFGLLKSLFVIPILFGFQIYSYIKAKPTLKPHLIHTLLLSGAVVALIGLSQIGTMSRIKSVYDVPNSLALFLVPLAVLALSLREKLSRYYGWVMVIAVVATQSVGAIAALFITLALGYFRKNSSYSLSIFLLLTLIFLTTSGRLGYFLSPLSNTHTHTSLDVRLQLWRASLALIKDHPLVGMGLGQFEPAYQQKLHTWFAHHPSPNLLPEFVFRDPHNFILSFWLNTGLLGLISFIGLNIYILKKSYSLPTTNYSLLALLLYGLVDTIYWKNDLAALYWLLIALLIAEKEGPPAIDYTQTTGKSAHHPLLSLPEK